MTALHYAADRGFLEVVKLLVEHGANKQAEDKEGQTPLDFAEACEHEEVIAYLRS
jgi:ankyrin repeat protein